MRRFTKIVYEIKHLPYQGRLRELGALTVQHKLLFADMVFVHRCIYGGLDGSQFGLSVVSSRTRENGVALTQNNDEHVLDVVLKTAKDYVQDVLIVVLCQSIIGVEQITVQTDMLSLIIDFQSAFI